MAFFFYGGIEDQLQGILTGRPAAAEPTVIVYVPAAVAGTVCMTTCLPFAVAVTGPTLCPLVPETLNVGRKPLAGITTAVSVCPASRTIVKLSVSLVAPMTACVDPP